MSLALAHKRLAEEAEQAAEARARARLLGLTRAQLYFRLEKYGLADPAP